MQPLLSIVIPTRNRQKYCIAAIQDILSYDYPCFELCIQDNSDDNQIEDYINNYVSDSRILYKRIPNQIASVFNIGGSLGMATGKYVIMIGDDDTILPSLFSTVEYMNKNNIDSLCSKPILNYYWPLAHSSYPHGGLVIPSDIDYRKLPKLVDVKFQIDLLFKRGIIRYSKYDLPKIYHGIVKREYVKKIHDKIGLYCGGLSPDIYLVISLSSLVKNHYTIQYPLTIAGVCSSSTSSAKSKDSQVGKLETMPHLNLRGEYIWDELVPAYYSGDTIWAESALKAVSDMQIPNLRKLFNYNYFCAYTLLYHRSIFKLVLQKSYENLNKLDKNKISFTVNISFIMSSIVSKQIFKEIYRKIKKDKNDLVITNNVDHIKEASKLFQKLY